MRNRSFGPRGAFTFCICCVSALGGQAVLGQQDSVTAHIEIEKSASAKPGKSSSPALNLSQVVVWLVPLDRARTDVPAPPPAAKKGELIQKNKSFIPHLVVVQVGSVVDFPNRDPFFHNVFSLFDGKRFDLGLYEAGATNSVRFDHPGISFLFCNIHPEMSAVVIAVETPYYAESDKSGNVSIQSVPDGKYELHVWYERGLPEDLHRLTRVVQIGAGSHDLGAILVRQNPTFSLEHKNKYGQDYAPPPSPGYSHP